MGWDPRSPFERMMDEIAAATSVREVDHLRDEVRKEFSNHPQVDALWTLLDAKRRVLAGGDDRA